MNLLKQFCADIVLASRFLTLAAALAWSITAQAQVAGPSVQDLLDGDTVTAGDKLFSNWHLSSDSGIDWANVFVSPVNSDPLNPGLNFIAENGAWSAQPGPTGMMDFELLFDVTVLNDAYRIKDASVELTGVTIGDATEDYAVLWYLDSLNNPIFSLELSDINSSDSTVFDPTSSLQMLLQGGLLGDTNLEIGGVNVRFSQVAVPEPASLALIGIGLAGLGFSRRKTA